MSVHRSFKFLLYQMIRKFLPVSTIHILGASKLTKSMRDSFFRPKEKKITIGDYIQFEHLSFYFEGLFSVFYKAQKTGIEAGLTRLIISHLKSGYTAIDIGANYGFITMAMGKSVGEGGRVLSFEPVTDIFAILKSSISKNRLDNTCIALQNFVGRSDQPGFISLDQIIEERQIDRIDFIKIDVDGGDYDVLLGASKSLKRFHPNLIVEISQNQQEIFDFIQSLGYKYILDMSGKEVKPPQFLPPLNLIAGMEPLYIPERGSLVAKYQQENAKK